MPEKFSGPLTDKGVIGDVRDFFLDFPLSQGPDHVYKMYDFAEVALDLTNDWTAIKDGSASAAAIVADEVGGAIILASQATTDDSGGSLQGNEIWLPAAGRTIWFETRFKSSDADQQQVYMGFSQNFATNPEAVLLASNRIGFQVDDGNASILCISEAVDVESSKDSNVDLVDDTYITVGLRISGLNKVEYFVNRVLKNTITTEIPTTELALALMQLSGNATGTKSMSVDYVMAAATR